MASVESVLAYVVRGKLAVTPVCKDRPRFAVWESDPLAPVAVTVKVPVDALLAAEKLTAVLDVAATVKGLAGFEVTPVGNPLSVTCTVSENPLIGVMDRLVAGLALPCCTLTIFWAKEIAKSGCAGGDGGEDGGGALDEPPPQPQAASSKHPREIPVERSLPHAIERPRVRICTLGT